MSPFKSPEQERFLWARHPKIAQKWTEEYGSKPEKKSDVLCWRCAGFGAIYDYSLGGKEVIRCPICGGRGVLEKKGDSMSMKAKIAKAWKAVRDPEAVAGNVWFHGNEKQREGFGSTEGRGTSEKPPKKWWNTAMRKIGKTWKEVKSKSMKPIRKFGGWKSFSPEWASRAYDSFARKKTPEEALKELEKIDKRTNIGDVKDYFDEQEMFSGYHRKAGVAQIPTDYKKYVPGHPQLGKVKSEWKSYRKSMKAKSIAEEEESVLDYGARQMYDMAYRDLTEDQRRLIRDMFQKAISRKKSEEPLYCPKCKEYHTPTPGGMCSNCGYYLGGGEKAEDSEFTKERKEHPSFSDVQIKQIVLDHKKLEAKHSKEIQHGTLPNERLARHEIGMKEYAEVEAAFLTEGEFHTGGIPYKYSWDVIERDKDTFKDREFFIGHSENSGLEYGLINDVQAKTIDGINWLVAKIKIPETDFTKDLLSRIENGLIKYVSTTHSFFVDPNDSERNVQRITGKAISTVIEPEVEDAKVLSIQRHIKAVLSL